MDATAANLHRPLTRAAAPDPLAASAGDDELVRRAQAGDRAALEALTGRYRERVYAFCLGIVVRAEDAEDVTQETFLRVWRNLPGYQSRGQFRSWLFQIAANLCRDHHRTSRRRPQTVACEDSPPIADTTDHGAEVALRSAVSAAISRLPATYREVVALHYLEDLPPVEIAALLGRSRAAVRVQLWRARALLARELADWLD